MIFHWRFFLVSCTASFSFLFLFELICCCLWLTWKWDSSIATLEIVNNFYCILYLHYISIFHFVNFSLFHFFRSFSSWPVLNSKDLQLRRICWFWNLLCRFHKNPLFFLSHFNSQSVKPFLVVKEETIDCEFTWYFFVLSGLHVWVPLQYMCFYKRKKNFLRCAWIWKWMETIWILIHRKSRFASRKRRLSSEIIFAER